MTTDYVVLLAGSRDLADPKVVHQFLDDRLTYVVTNGYGRLVVRHGACPGGADLFADQWVAIQQPILPVVADRHPAQNHPTQDFGPWPGAGPRRNGYMVGLGAHECRAFIGPCTSPRCRRPEPHGSHGATGCADLAETAGITTYRMELWNQGS